MKSPKSITYYVCAKTKTGENLLGFYFLWPEVPFYVYSPSDELASCDKKNIDEWFMSRHESEAPIDIIESMMKEENIVKSVTHLTYRCGPYQIELEAKREKKFLVFHNGAEKGQRGYSPVEHSVPHCEGNGPTGIKEWVPHYSFFKMSDGTFEVELEEAWRWGGSHADGGEITDTIPPAWFKLPYEEFLEKVLTLCKASHYLFTVEELLKRRGLKKFFGFESV